MPIAAATLQVLKTGYEAAEAAPDKQYSTRLQFAGREFKVRIELANPDWPPGTVLITLKPRPNGE